MKGNDFASSWASVTQVSPLLVKPRGTSTAVPAFKLSFVPALSVGDQVAYIPHDRSINGTSSILVLGKVV